ncbi:MAG: M48 family metalloprotease [Bdellovibrionales bacterium]|nr:M48 family metalloprotease [Bdellovibrionales bacterium]
MNPHENRGTKREIKALSRQVNLVENKHQPMEVISSHRQLFDKLKWMTTQEAAFYLRVSVGQVRNMVWRRQVKVYRLQNRLRFLRSDLDALLKPSTKEAMATYKPNLLIHRSTLLPWHRTPPMPSMCKRCLRYILLTISQVGQDRRARKRARPEGNPVSKLFCRKPGPTNKRAQFLTLCAFLSIVTPMKKTLVFNTLMAAMMMAGCVKIPETGKSAFIITTPSQETQLGEEGYKEVLKESKINKDPRLNAMIQRVGKKIAAEANQKDFKWEFTIIESKEQNAWCMPGGKVAFYTGILPHLKNEAGMAAVMGHEVAHAILRHSGQRISQQYGTNIILGVLSAGLSNSQHKEGIMTALGAGATLGVILPFSRSHESEADIVGLKYMAKAGYDPMEAVRFWERFKAAGGGAPPEFLSTHPSGDTRIHDLKAKMPEAMNWYNSASPKLGLGEAI